MRVSIVALLVSGMIAAASLVSCDNDFLSEGAAVRLFGAAELEQGLAKARADSVEGLDAGGGGNTDAMESSGIWVDEETGLEWQATPTWDESTWTWAKAKCENLNLEGPGWRLPTIGELRSLLRGCSATVAGGGCRADDQCLSWWSCDNEDCSGCLANGGPSPAGLYWPAEISGDCCVYWSSSVPTDSEDGVWVVNFRYGEIQVDHVIPGAYARCVR